MDAVLWAVESQQGFGGGVRDTVNLVLEGTCGCWPHMSPARCWQKQEAPPGAPTATGPGDSPGLSSSDNGIGITMETRSPHGDRPGKSPGTSPMDLDLGSPQSVAVFFLPKPLFGPGPNPAGRQHGPWTAHSAADTRCHQDLPTSWPVRLAPPRPLSFTLKLDKSHAGGGRKL